MINDGEKNPKIKKDKNKSLNQKEEEDKRDNTLPER